MRDGLAFLPRLRAALCIRGDGLFGEGDIAGDDVRAVFRNGDANLALRRSHGSAPYEQFIWRRNCIQLSRCSCACLISPRRLGARPVGEACIGVLAELESLVQNPRFDH